jgi:GDP-L-fucose synthase
MDKDAKIYVAGHTGLVGGAITRQLEARGCRNIVRRTHAELDLRDQAAARAFFAEERPRYVFCAAARVGGIQANSAFMAGFSMENLQITCNIIDCAHIYGVEKLLYLGSSCIYPRECPQPVREDYLLTGPLEPTNEGYALAKIVGVRLCEYYRKQYGAHFISCMPANLYGPGDCYDESKNHVVPALIRRFHNAKIGNLPAVEIWGTGAARREFMYIDDAAEACVFLMEHYDGASTMNAGTGCDTSIAELAALVAAVTGYPGSITLDTTKPDGMPRRMLDSARIQALGFTAKTPLRQGLERAYDWYLQNIAEAAHDK